MQKLITVLSCALILSGCDSKPSTPQPPQTPEAPPAPLVAGFEVGDLDTSIHPGDDFFAYANGKALDAIEIPADKSSYGEFSRLRDKSDAQVRTIIEESASGDFPEGSDQQRVGDLYNSFMDWEARDAKGTAPLQDFLEQINGFETHDDVFAYFGTAARYQIQSPIDMWQYADAKDPGTYAFYLSQGGLGLPDRAYYFTDDEKSEEIRQEYKRYMADLHQLAGLPFDDTTVARVYALEERIADRHMPKEQARRYAENYTRIEAEELPELTPGVDWRAYLTAMGIEDPGYLVSISTDYFNALGTIITETPVADWQAYFRWATLNSSAQSLTRDLDQRRFDFYRKALTGVQEQQPDWQRGVSVVGGTIGELVGKVYVERHFPPEAKARMDELVANLISAYEDSVRQLDWMSDATKAEALQKLSKFTPMIGYPDTFRDYAGAAIKADDYYGNLRRILEAERNREIERHLGEVDRTEWSMTPQTVNAYYSPILNVIVFPAAILQPPFFNLAADDAINYGGIGAVIGHEIGHGLDDNGKNFDGDGNLRNWWTEDDSAQFDVRTSNLIAQYNAFCPFDDLCTNGEFTLGENIGDLGGISIALKAYQASLDGNEGPMIDGLTGMQRVFLGFAQVWRSKMRDEALRTLIATNPHAPGMYRTNGPVRNVPEWYEAFDVTPDNALYLAPEERVKIW